MLYCESCGRELIEFDDEMGEYVECDCGCMGIGLEFCAECGEKLDDECVKMETEREEFWGAPCHYEVIVGYQCGSCGYEEDY